MKIVNFIGCGKLGQTLGKLFTQAKILKIGGIYNPNLARAQLAQAFIGAGTAVDNLAELPPADLYFLAVPDGKIVELGEKLLRVHQPQNSQAIFVHFSGALGHDILQQPKQQGFLIASVHPVKSLADPQLAAESFAGTYCGFSGDLAAEEVLAPIFAQIGAHFFQVKGNKSLYHAAAVFASNYVLVLSAVAADCLAQAGVEDEIAAILIQQLMQSVGQNIAQDFDHRQALTGPLARGDSPIIREHLKNLSPQYQELYLSLAQNALPLISKPQIQQKMREFLENLLALS